MCTHQNRVCLSIGVPPLYTQKLTFTCSSTRTLHRTRKKKRDFFFEERHARILPINRRPLLFIRSCVQLNQTITQADSINANETQVPLEGVFIFSPDSRADKCNEIPSVFSWQNHSRNPATTLITSRERI
jgi:hypothetical protein